MDSDSQIHDGDPTDPTVSPARNAWERFRAYHTAPLQREYPAGGGPDTGSAGWLDPGFLVRCVLFVVLAGYFIAQASVYWLAVIDDSYITFRFVDMFVKGYGWRFSPEGPRVEGFTNFLWAAALVPPHYLGWDLMYVSKIYGLICGILTMAASWGLARAIRGRDDFFNLLAPAFLATNAHFAHWSMMGLETLLQCALVTGAYYRFEVERRDARRWLVSPLFCVLAAMTRIDSLYYLSPLGLYGLWLVLLCRLPIKRMLLWGVIAAVPFTVYWTWRWNYFGDMLPNTYYAKQRFVSVEGHDRGALQLQIFYLKQGDFNSPIPPPLDQIDETASNASELRTARVAWKAFFGEYNSFLWINLWLGAALLCGCAMLIRFAIPRGDPQWRALEAGVQFGKIGCLVLLPWLLNLYYVYHVNGDWMPCFRFFQIVLGFMAVAVAVGFGSVAQFLAVAFRHPVVRLGALAAAFAVPVYLLAGVAYEQGRIMSVYIFGKDGIYWAGRSAGWYKPAEVRKSYSKGFSPPLEYVSNYLLLNTQDDAWIFMSDIGQPLWFAEHLNLYDVDGLTDPFLAHAPSTRGNLPTLADQTAAVMKEWGIEKPNREQRKRIEDEAQRRDFEAFLARNARYIMDQRRPEYLLLFINHVSPDPKSEGGAYPQISWRVWKHANMKDYVEDWTVSKIGNAYNHVFRRADVPKEVPDDVKLKRLYRAIERNPRIISLVILLEREARMMKALPPTDEERIRAIIIRTIERFPDDPNTRQLVSSSLYSKDSKLVQKALAISLEHDPDSISGYFILADAYEKEGNLAKAEETVLKAIPLAPADDNSVLYRLIWLNEQLNRPEKVREYARQAIKRRPKDDRPWSDLASSLERLASRAGIPAEEALSLRREALIDYRKMAEIRGETPDYLRDVMERLERQIAPAAPPQPTPLPQPTQIPQQAIDPALQIPLNAPVETDYQP